MAGGCLWLWVGAGLCGARLNVPIVLPGSQQEALASPFCAPWHLRGTLPGLGTPGKGLFPQGDIGGKGEIGGEKEGGKNPNQNPQGLEVENVTVQKGD